MASADTGYLPVLHAFFSRSPPVVSQSDALFPMLSLSSSAQTFWLSPPLSPSLSLLLFPFLPPLSLNFFLFFSNALYLNTFSRRLSNLVSKCIHANSLIALRIFFLSLFFSIFFLCLCFYCFRFSRSLSFPFTLSLSSRTPFSSNSETHY